MTDSLGNKTYIGQFTKVFEKGLKKVDKVAQERIRNLVDDTLKNPYYNSVFLKGVLRGKRKRRAGVYRINYAICEECRKLSHTGLNECVDCSNCEDGCIKFFDCGHRDKFYD